MPAAAFYRSAAPSLVLTHYRRPPTYIRATFLIVGVPASLAVASIYLSLVVGDDSYWAVLWVQDPHV